LGKMGGKQGGSKNSRGKPHLVRVYSMCRGKNLRLINTGLVMCGKFGKKHGCGQNARKHGTETLNDEGSGPGGQKP